jgi:hypothetical protein
MLSTYPTQDFRYNRQGVYHNEPPSNRPIRKKRIKRDSGTGPICPGCGLGRSMTNKCECNS